MKRIYIKTIYIGVFTIANLLFFESTSFTDQNNISFQVFFTSDLSGYLKPCG